MKRKVNWWAWWWFSVFMLSSLLRTSPQEIPNNLLSWWQAIV